MIGKRVRFIRAVWKANGHGIEANRLYEGEVLDKCCGCERVEGRFMRMDYYLVLIDEGLIAKFWCDEAVGLVAQEPCQSDSDTRTVPEKDRTTTVPKKYKALEP